MRLRDSDGEEIVAFDAGHRSSSRGKSPPASVPPPPAAGAGSPEKRAAATEPAVVVGLTADTSEAGPVVVTAGADGTVRVHALAVHYRGKQVAGAGARGGRSRRKEGTGKRKEAPVGSKGDEGVSGSRPRKLQEETPPQTVTQTGEAAVEDDSSTDSSSSSSSSRKGDGSYGQRKASKAEVDGGGGGDKSRLPPTPPATAMGVGISVDFKACLGSACDSSGDTKDDIGVEAGSVPSQVETATVTSMDAFYHRS